MKYAIVESGGKQYKAVEGAMLEVDRLPVETGASLKLEQVLLVADGQDVTIGTPVIKDTPIWATVVEHFKGPKVVIYNYRPKKRIRVKTGHRQNYTRLLVDQIGGVTLLPKKEPEKVLEAKAEAPAAKTKPESRAEKKPAAKPKSEKKPAARKAAPAAAKAAAKAKPAAKKPAPKTSTKKPAAKPSDKK